MENKKTAADQRGTTASRQGKTRARNSKKAIIQLKQKRACKGGAAPAPEQDIF